MYDAWAAYDTTAIGYIPVSGLPCIVISSVNTTVVIRLSAICLVISIPPYTITVILTTPVIAIKIAGRKLPVVVPLYLRTINT
jgi:hypothetical protein